MSQSDAPCLIFLTGDTLSPEAQAFLSCQWRSVSCQTLSGHGTAAGSAAHVAEAVRGRLLRDLAFQDSCLPVQSASPRRRPWLKHPAYP